MSCASTGVSMSEPAPCGDARPVERAGVRREQEHRAEQAEVADAVGDERLLAGRGVGELVVPEADEQVRAEADALPPDEQHREVVRQDERQHREDEEVQVREEPGEARVVRHVGGRVEVDEEADAGDDQHHHADERVDAEADVDGDARAVAAGGVHPAPRRPGRA